MSGSFETTQRGAPRAAEAAAEALEHPSLAAAQPERGAAPQPLAEAPGTDRSKLGIVLQGAALLSLCEAAGWTLAGGWATARIDARGRLHGLALRPGRDRAAVQSRLLELLLALFRAQGRIAGRGEARRAARSLIEVWEGALVPMSSDDAIGLLFEAAPFLWESEFDTSRAALRGSFVRAQRRVDWIAGPPAVRRRFLEPSAGDGAGADPRTPLELAAASLWSEAVRRWHRTPPASDAERLELARSLFALGRFEAAELLVAERDDVAALALRAGCRLLLGELAAARELVDRIAVRELDAAERIEHGDLALRLFTLTGDRDAAHDWAARSKAAAKTLAQKARAALLLATSALDAGDLAGAVRQAGRARELFAQDGGGADAARSEAWRLEEVLAWIAIEQGDGDAIVEASRRLLGRARRRMRRFEAGRAWNNLGLGLLERGEYARAERAFTQSARLLRRCDGPLAITLPQSNLVEARLRSGKLLEVEPILRASAAYNRRSGNRRGLAVDEALWVRFELVRGQPEAALSRAERAWTEPLFRDAGQERATIAALAARAAGWLERLDEAAEWRRRAGAAGERELDREEIPGMLALAGDLDAARERSLESGSAVWQSVLRGDTPSPEALAAALEPLEPFRRARLVLDLELVLPGTVGNAARDAAASQFRRLGVVRYAALLERGAASAWTALRSYLERTRDRPPGGAEAAELLRAVGHPEASLRFRSRGVDRVWVEGRGLAAAAVEELSFAVDGGELVLAAAALDEPLRAAFALLARDARPPRFAAAESAVETADDDGMVGRSAPLLAALERLRQFAASDMPLLLLGESGTGKELAALEARRRSPRAERAWVPINCAALSETLLLSDLFGHARGAFTGADRPHAGVFETAHGGTVFLDEIGDLPLTAQGNLLRVLQEGEVRRLGETTARKVEFRLITATHRDLTALVREGRFRQDLYYRLKVCTVVLPPLRERGDDIELLADRFLDAERRRLGRSELRLTPEARRRLATHSWPGNVRELQHVLRAAAVLSGDGAIGPAALELEGGRDEALASVGDYHRAVLDYRRALVVAALSAAEGNRAAAARRLGISRQALSYLVRELELDS